MSKAAVLALLGVYAVARKAFAWPKLSLKERRAAIRYVLLMGGGGVLVFSMASLLDGGFAAGWPTGAIVLWAIGISAGVLAAFGGWAKLMGVDTLPGETTRRTGSESFLSLVPRQGPAWRHRARRGAVMMLLWGGMGGIALFVVMVVRGSLLIGMVVTLGFFLVLAMSGAVGGLAYHFTEPFRSRGRAWHLAANVISLLAYCAATIVLLALGVAAAQALGVVS